MQEFGLGGIGIFILHNGLILCSEILLLKCITSLPGIFIPFRDKIQVLGPTESW